MNYGLGFILDGIILVFLCVTIFYAARLTIFFKTFREGRDGLQKLINDLSVSVTKAESAIVVMKKNAVESEKDLRELVSESKFLSDELRFMNEAGDGLARRLERLAERNRELLSLLEDAGGIGHAPTQARSEKPKAKQPKAKQPKESPIEQDVFQIDEFDMDELDQDDEADFQAFSNMDDLDEKPTGHGKEKFSIFDREHDDEELKTKAVSTLKPQAKKQEQFYSRAEQDLYEALQNKKASQKNTGTN